MRQVAKKLYDQGQGNIAGIGAIIRQEIIELLPVTPINLLRLRSQGSLEDIY